ncbi:MAG: hypothetical protein QX196_04210 [Methylococcaceae bacterium]
MALIRGGRINGISIKNRLGKGLMHFAMRYFDYGNFKHISKVHFNIFKTFAKRQ